MASGPRRPAFYLGILIGGFLIGGFLTELFRQFLPDSVAKQVFTYTVTPTLGPVSLDLLVVNLTLGPLGVHVSILSLIGVAVAYLLARSLF